MKGKEWGDNDVLYNIAQPKLSDHDICLDREETIKLIHLVIAIIGIVLSIYPNKVFKLVKGMSFFRHLRIKGNIFVLSLNSKRKALDILEDIAYKQSKTEQFKEFVRGYVDKLITESNNELEKS